MGFGLYWWSDVCVSMSAHGLVCVDEVERTNAPSRVPRVQYAAKKVFGSQTEQLIAGETTPKFDDYSFGSHSSLFADRDPACMEEEESMNMLASDCKIRV